MQVRKWLISGEINYNVCRICSLTLLPPEVLIPTPITLSVTIHECDRRTDRILIARPRLHYMQRGKNCNIFYHFSQKNTRNSLFLQYRTLVGNNSSSVEDRTMQFAYSRGLFDMADRMV